MRIPVNDIHLNVIDQGSGPLTLVLLHYFGGSALEWGLVMNKLADQYRCIAIDLRGHGDSDPAGAPAVGDPASENGYAVDTMAVDVAAVLRALNVGRFVLVGHSMSSKVAMALASQNPAGLQALLMLAPSPPVPEPIPEADRQQMLQTHGEQKAAEDTFWKITTKPVSEAARKQIVADNLRTAKAAWDAWLLTGSNENISDRMSLIAVPVHLLTGTHDRALKPDVSKTMTMPYFKNATLETVQGAGHLLPWEVPDVVAAFIRTFCATSDQPAPVGKTGGGDNQQAVQVKNEPATVSAMAKHPSLGSII